MVRSTAVATVCGFLLASCAVHTVPYSSNVHYSPSHKDNTGLTLPRTVLLPQGTMLVVPDYSTGETQAVIQVSK